METSAEDPSHRRIYESLKEAYPYYDFDRARFGHEIENTTLLAVVAPTAAGKSTLINKTLSYDEDIHLYESSTTRPPEPRDNGEYLRVSFEDFATAAAERSLVNYFPHPNGHIYGTFTNGFKAPVTIGAIATATLEQLFNAGFREVRTVYTVMDGPTYEERLGLDQLSSPQSRINSPDIRKRLVESLRSLSFAAANAQEDWITGVQLTNEPGSLERSAFNLARIAHERTAESLTPKRFQALATEMAVVARTALNRLDEV